MNECICEGRQLELGRVLEEKEKELSDLIIGHSVKEIIKVGYGSIDSFVFDNNIILTNQYNDRFVFYDNQTVLEFDLYRLKYRDRLGSSYYILKSNAECDLEEALVRYKHGKEDWNDIDKDATVETVHFKITPYKMMKLNIVDEECGFVNQDRNWIDYLEYRRKEDLTN